MYIIVTNNPVTIADTCMHLANISDHDNMINNDN